MAWIRISPFPQEDLGHASLIWSEMDLSDEITMASKNIWRTTIFDAITQLTSLFQLNLKLQKMSMNGENRSSLRPRFTA